MTVLLAGVGGLAPASSKAAGGTDTPIGASGPTGPAGPAASEAPFLQLLAPEVAWGGRLALRVGAGPAGVRLQARGRSGWRTAALLPGSTGPRIVVVRVASSGTRAAFRLVLADRPGPERRARLRALVLASVGDVNLGDVPGRQIARFGPAWPWASVGSVLRAADLAFANLECAVSERGTAQVKTYTFRGRPSSARAAAQIGGLDVVNLANNHAVDFGRLALLDGLRTLRDAGVAAVGAGVDAAAAYRPVVVRRLGLRVAFVGFSEIQPFDFRAGPRSPGTAWAFRERVRAGVRTAHRQADVVVATFHWGVERRTVENAEQRSLARLALASGAQIVVGAHPHVQQPVRRIGRRRLIAYSLGNFVFGAHSSGAASTRILELGLASDGVRSVRSIPAHIVGGRPILARLRR